MSEKNEFLKTLRLLSGGFSPVTALKLTAEDFQTEQVQSALKAAADALEAQITPAAAPVAVAKKGGKGSRGPRGPRKPKGEAAPVVTNGAGADPQPALLS